jgi:hypothetical protein
VGFLEAEAHLGESGLCFRILCGVVEVYRLFAVILCDVLRKEINGNIKKKKTHIQRNVYIMVFLTHLLQIQIMPSLRCYFPSFQNLPVHAAQYLVEDMVVALFAISLGNTGLLQQIGHYVATVNGIRIVEIQHHPFAETTGVRVADSLRIAESFEDRRGSDDAVCDL